MSQFASEVFVYDAVRTPKGRVKRAGGTLADVPAYELLATLLRALRERGLDPEQVHDMVIGTSTAAGEQGGDIARAAALWAQWPDTVPGGVVSRLCCSGLDAIGTATAKVASGMNDVVLAGGVESMSRVPMLFDKPSFAFEGELQDATGYVTIGVAADLTAADAGFTREELDAYAVRSHQRAAAAPMSDSVIPIRPGDTVVLARDEGARPDADLAGFAALATLFGDDPSWDLVARQLPDSLRPEGGLHTVGTAPQLCDGASAAVLGSGSAGSTLGTAPIGEIVAATQTAVRSPRLTAGVQAARDALERAGITAADLDVIEANESFAVSPLLLTRELDLDPARVNPNGGSVATGHPLGASGGSLLVNALDQLARVDGEFALLAIPGGLGLGAAVVVRRV
ncbi:thiolase family protein [Gordonia alkaliphila]|uniref:thiolase family protein n=1 Tax=Gordonia alkaliphila TaxID=1053547 RepID=UPI001FF4CE50|nr:thiolase family protein [Gordonia alkaliphila]MCK0439065.1 thiolase family protein [Gordonia alkaliphila]